MRKLLAIISTALITTFGLASCGEADPAQNAENDSSAKTNTGKEIIKTDAISKSGAQMYGSGKPNTTTKAS